jgi:ubiquitin carboxyl-terminal hydrolase 7
LRGHLTRSRSLPARHQLYDPVAETLSYIGRLFASPGARIGDLSPLVAPLAGLPPSAELLFFEEIKFEPSVMVEALDKKSTLKAR